MGRGNRGRRPEGARRPDRPHPRPRAHGPGHARDRRARRAAPAARGSAHAEAARDPDVGDLRGVVPDQGDGGGGGRLPDQAVLGAGAAGAGGPAARRGRAAPRGRRGEREPLPRRGGPRAGADLDVRRGRARQLPEPAHGRVHRAPPAGAGRPRMGGRDPSGGPRAHAGGAPCRLPVAAALRAGGPRAPPRRRVPLDADRGSAAPPVERRVRGLRGHQPRHHGENGGRRRADAAAGGHGAGARAGGGRQPDERRVPGHAFARAAHASQRDRGLGPPAARGPSRRGHLAPRPGDDRPQREDPDAAHRRHPRRLAHRQRQAPRADASPGAGADRGGGPRHRAPGRRGEGHPRGRGPRSGSRARARATPTACSRSCGTSSRTRSSSRPTADTWR